MDKPKIYVVMNANKLKDLCEKRLGNDITADNYIDLEGFRDEKIYLIKKDFPDAIYIGTDIPQYDMYINVQDEWKLNNIVNITDTDIEELLENHDIEDIKIYRNWKEVLGYKILSNQTFCRRILPLLTDEDSIRAIKMLSRNPKITDRVYLVYDNDCAYIYINTYNISYKLPQTVLSKECLSDIIQYEAVENISCKINEDNKLIKFDNKTMHIMSSKPLTIRVLQRNNRYVIRTYIRDIPGYSTKNINVFGNTKEEAIYRLRHIMEDDFSKKVINDLFGHKDIKSTLDLYKNLAKPFEDKEY